MAEGDGVIYNKFKVRILNKEIDLDTDTLKLGLTSAYTPDIDADLTWADAGTEEVGSGYTTGGQTVAGASLTLVSASDLAKFDATDVIFTGLDVGTPSHAVLYDTTASDALVAYWELGSTASNGGNYTIAWNASGIITIT